MWQARRVAVMLSERLGAASEIVVISTRGDRIQDVAFRKMEGKGFFTKELQDALLDGTIDLVVHSLKDLPTAEPPGLELVAIPERGDPLDMLLALPGRIADVGPAEIGVPDGGVVGTSSLRRAAQVLAASPNAEIRALRGNVPTRVRKLRAGDYDAIILAAAGVRRLGLDLTDLDARVLATEAMLPAPGQGALAIEARSDDPRTKLLSQLHDASVARCVAAERALLELLGGGCHLPLGCLATEDTRGIRLQAVLGEIDDAATEATVARVGAVATDSATAAEICFHALRLDSGERA